MSLKILPVELIELIYSYVCDYTFYKKKITRTVTFLKYKYEFDVYFNNVNDPFYKYILNNKIFKVNKI
tara:strand:+ start:102 stop:305 length:204 start_codon:yes stop_codon:yes gene_type:complete